MIRTIAILLLAASAAAAQEWPRFRGPDGQGHSPETGLPQTWNATTNVAWKTEIPGEGWSSPIVWGEKVFLTAASDGGKSCHVLCVSAADGKLLWDSKVFEQPTERKEGKNSYATPTPCTDGERVCAVFGGGSVVALDLSGKELWTNHDVKFYSRHGLGASPILHNGLLIMPYDGSQRVPEAGKYPKVTDEERTGWQIPWDKSEVVALDVKTGKRAWTGKRGMSRIAHVTPMVVDGQILSIAGDVVQGFDPKSGKLLWTVVSEGEGVTPSPAVAEGLVFASSGFPKATLRAIKFGGTGDGTSTNVLWEQKKGCPTQPSLLYVKPYLYAVTEAGIATCYKAESGEIVWQERLAEKTAFSASPVVADEKIYVLSEVGETIVLAPGPEFKVLARNPLGEKCQASPALSRGRIFIRSEKNLFCIGGK